jgi:hypothetical protein
MIGLSSDKMRKLSDKRIDLMNDRGTRTLPHTSAAKLMLHLDNN